MKCSAVFNGDRVIIRYGEFLVILDFKLADPDADPMGTSVAGLAIAVYPQNKPQS